MSPVRLVDLAAAVIADRQGTAKPGVILVNRVSPHMPMAWGDPGRVEQILRHLVTNACQHTRSGTISIEGEVVAYRVVVQIRDTGEGISAPLLSSLFVPFQQNSDADTRSKNGLGLGLAISRQLADSMSAVLTVDSQLGVGTRARLSLLPCPADQARSLTPSVAVKRPSLPVPALPPAPDPGVPKPEESPLVLIVDDEPVNLMILRSYLGRLNLSVLEAESGPRALELIAQHPVKLVILDVMMPGMSGYEVSRKLRESYTPEQLPIILLTAKEQQEDMVKGFASGATDFIIKPYEREDLRRRIEFQLSLTSTK
jgi:two-component system sensor histidine kinase ChiS